MVYQLKYDSVHGRFQGPTLVTGENRNESFIFLLLVLSFVSVEKCGGLPCPWFVVGLPYPWFVVGLPYPWFVVGLPYPWFVVGLLANFSVASTLWCFRGRVLSWRETVRWSDVGTGPERHFFFKVPSNELGFLASLESN